MSAQVKERQELSQNDEALRTQHQAAAERLVYAERDNLQLQASATKSRKDAAGAAEQAPPLEHTLFCRGNQSIFITPPHLWQTARAPLLPQTLFWLHERPRNLFSRSLSLALSFSPPSTTNPPTPCSPYDARHRTERFRRPTSRRRPPKRCQPRLSRARGT